MNVPCRTAGAGSIRSALLLHAALFVCLTGAACAPEQEAPPEIVRPVKLLVLQASGGEETFEFPGTVAAAQHAEMAFEVPGKITDLPVTQGQAVEKGQVLARLDPREYQSRADAASARERATRATCTRQEKLFKEGVVSAQQLDVARKDYEVAKAEADSARKSVEDTILRAPFSGRIARTIKQDYKNVQAKEVVLVLQDDGHLEISVDVPERLVARARPGLSIAERNARMKSHAVIPSLPDQTIPLQLKEFATEADPVTRTYEVTFQFQPPPGVSMMPGMTARVYISTPRQDKTAEGICVPIQAVITDEHNLPCVWRIDPEAMTARRTPVALGDMAGDEIAIRSGLRSGDTIVVSGVHQLRDGMPVKPVQ